MTTTANNRHDLALAAFTAAVLAVAFFLTASFAACSPDAGRADAGAHDPGVHEPSPPRPAGRPDFVTARPMLLPGESATIVEEYTGGATTVHESGSATGAGAIARGEKLSDSLTGSAPAIGLGGGVSAAGGAFTRDVRVEPIATAARNPLLWAGLLGVVGAGVAFYFGLRRAALVSLACGAGLIVAAMLPAWAWAVIALGAAAAGGVYLWSEFHGKRAGEALRAVAAGVADVKGLAPESYKIVTERIGAHADNADVRTISAVKAKDRL